MFILRANSYCPSCNTSHEIWFDKGKIVPSETITCDNCSYIFDPYMFVQQLLNLRNSFEVTSRITKN